MTPADPLREKLRALVEEWRKWCDTFERKPTSYEEALMLVVLGESECKALDAVLNYSIPDEAQDFREQFENAPNLERENSHVLTALVTLSNALHGGTTTPRGVAGLEEEI
jgi:hypothetical protein